MPQFSFRTAGFEEIKKKLIVRMSIVMGTIFVIIIVVPAFMTDEPGRLQTLPYMGLFFMGIYAFSMFNALKRQRRILNSITVTIDDEKITFEKYDTAPLSINNKDIVSITKSSGGSFTVLGQSKLNPIGIPSQMNDYAILESTLNQIRPVIVLTSKTWMEWLTIPIALSGGILIAIFYLSTNNILKLIFAILIVLILSISLALIQLSKKLDRRTKRISWISLVVIVVFITNLIIILDKV